MNFTDLIKFFVLIKKGVTLSAKFVFEKVSRHKKHLLRGILIGLAISIVVTILAWLGHFKPYENPLTDILQLITHKKANDVALLFITEEEYKRGFKGISPLSRERLADIINMLIKLEAKVIALDIDISDETTEEQDRRLAEALVHAATSDIPVVVAGVLKGINEKDKLGNDPNVDSTPYQNNKQHYTSDGYALFEYSSPGSQWIGNVMYGGVVFNLDPDGVFRHAEAIYMIKDSDSINKKSHRPIPSFPLAVAAASRGMTQENIENSLFNYHDYNITLPFKINHNRHNIHIHTAKGGRITPNFIGNYEHFDREVNLSELLEEYGPGRPVGKTIFKNKIVIVGGTYDKRDFYKTPIGEMSGMEIMANTIQSILSGTLITHASFRKAFIIEVALGAMVALIFVFTPRLWASVICFVTIVPAVATASILSFSSSYYWFDFVPTIAGVMIHGWVSKVEEELKVRR